MDGFLDFFYTSCRRRAAMKRGPRFYHSFPVGEQWLWARGTKGVRLFYFGGTGAVFMGFIRVLCGGFIWPRLFWAG